MIEAVSRKDRRDLSAALRRTIRLVWRKGRDACVFKIFILNDLPYAIGDGAIAATFSVVAGLGIRAPICR
jgi:hypothetical protein